MRRRARLASLRVASGVRSTMGAIWSNGTGEDVVQHERQPLGRRQGVQHHEQRQAHRVGQQRPVLGVVFAFRLDDRIRQVRDQLLAIWARRSRNVFRQIRATTVVSQASRLSMSLPSDSPRG